MTEREGERVVSEAVRDLGGRKLNVKVRLLGRYYWKGISEG